MADPKKLSTQQHLPFTAVFQDVLVLKDGNFRQIVLVSSINFGLKNEDEQNAIVYAYQSFLNSLTFPVQILIQSRQIDLGQYIANLKQQIFQQSNELIRYQTQEYIDFITRLISVANIMDKKFFVVVPYQKMDIKRGFFAPKNGNLQVSIAEFQKIKDELSKRVDVVEQGLAAMGLKSVTLTTEQIIELLYSSYNITQSLREKLQNAETLADATVVQQTTGAAPAGQGSMATSFSQQPQAQSYAAPNQPIGYSGQVPAATTPAGPTSYNVPIQGQAPGTPPSPASTAQAAPATASPAQGQNLDGIQPIQPIQ